MKTIKDKEATIKIERIINQTKTDSGYSNDTVGYGADITLHEGPFKTYFYLEERTKKKLFKSILKRFCPKKKWRLRKW